jgi:hypothetical protein
MKKAVKFIVSIAKRVENKIGERFHIISKALYGDKKNVAPSFTSWNQ